MNRRTALGLQGWLVASFVAVGVVAAGVLVLVLLPTLERNVRADHLAEARQSLRYQVSSLAAGAIGQDWQLDQVLDGHRRRSGAHLQMARPLGAGGAFVVAQSPRTPEAAARLDAARARLTPGQVAEVNAEVVMARARDRYDVVGVLDVGGPLVQLEAVRRRVMIATLAVIGLASLVGLALAHLIGTRLRRLATTATAITGGDLSARAPSMGMVPEELLVLQESLNTMAARLQGLVTGVTAERDRERAMMGALAEGVLAVAPTNRVSVANAAAARMLRVDDLGDVGGPLLLHMLPQAIGDLVRSSRGSGPGTQERRQVVLPGGAEVELHAAQSGALGTVVTVRDVTEQRRLDRARRDLVANVSHELKTPIAALKGFLELLEDGRVPEERRREFLESMAQETDRLERLVREQLQLARLDSGALPLDLHEVDLWALVHEEVEARAPLAAQEDLTLEVRREGHGSLVVLADSDRVEQVLLILLDNALRHTPTGGRVEVSVGRSGQDAQMVVRDTGEGIDPADLPFIFDRFYRADRSRVGRGAGLGLAIARGLVAAHRGEIGVESRRGEGTTFTVRLPLVSAGPVTEGSPIPDFA